jgi:hypothetical protein
MSAIHSAVCLQKVFQQLSGVEHAPTLFCMFKRAILLRWEFLELEERW